VDPVPDPLLLRKSDSAVNGTRDLWICSQDHRSSLILYTCRITYVNSRPNEHTVRVIISIEYSNPNKYGSYLSMVTALIYILILFERLFVVRTSPGKSFPLRCENIRWK
jgi:hypothetical protein